MADPPIGTLLQARVGPDRFPVAEMARLDPRNAAAEALAAYLRAAVFLVPGSPDQRFRLNQVLTEWPEDFHQLDQPAAAITSAVVTSGAHNLTPSVVEDSFDRHCPGTVLWKLAELQIQFQVDFWTTSKPERSAIAAAIHGLFAPTESRYGILVQGHPDYYGLPVRLTLDAHQRVDDSGTVFSRDRALRATVIGDIDVVQLRSAVELLPKTFVDGEPTGG